MKEQKIHEITETRDFNVFVPGDMVVAVGKPERRSLEPGIYQVSRYYAPYDIRDDALIDLGGDQRACYADHFVHAENHSLRSAMDVHLNEADVRALLASYRKFGIEPADAADWAAARISLDDACAWVSRFIDAHEAAEWRNLGFDIEQAGARHTVRHGHEGKMQSSFSPDEAARYRAAGLTPLNAISARDAERAKSEEPQ